MKNRYILDIPRLRPEEWSAEKRELSHGIQVTAYVPFDGDPSVFNLRPSAMKMTVAKGEIVNHDWRISITVSDPHIDIAGMVKRELAEIQWRLESLRGSMEYMNQQLETQLRICIRTAQTHRREQSECLAEDRHSISQTCSRARSVAHAGPRIFRTQTCGSELVTCQAGRSDLGRLHVARLAG